MSEAHPDAYVTLAGTAEGEWKDRGSRFLARGCPCRSRADLDALVAAARRSHPDARHHAAGLVLATDSTPVGQDDGEPSGSAGLPIANRILAAGLAEVGVVVTRWFGGTKLGRPGLIRAYGGAAAEALALGERVTRYHQRRLRLQVAWTRLSPVTRVLESTPGVDVLSRDFGEDCLIEVAVPRSAVETVAELADHTGEVRVTRLDD